MTEYIINIPSGKEALVKEFVKELGGSVEKKKTSLKKTPSKKSTAKKTAKKKAEPTFLFGQWKDFDLDAEKLREESWTRKFQPLDFFGTWPDIDLNPKTYRKKLWRNVHKF